MEEANEGNDAVIEDIPQLAEQVEDIPQIAEQVKQKENPRLIEEVKEEEEEVKQGEVKQEEEAFYFLKVAPVSMVPLFKKIPESTILPVKPPVEIMHLVFPSNKPMAPPL
jgi:hypothetical protein